MVCRIFLFLHRMQETGTGDAVFPLFIQTHGISGKGFTV
jgi:hypothetical protein